MPRSYKETELDTSRLKELLSYDGNTGIFKWRGTRIHVRSDIFGKIAGSLGKDGYIKIKLDNRLYPAHCLAWFYVHGQWPSDFIDHKNGNRKDNRIDNLRQSDGKQNRRNIKNSKNNSTGYKGVTFHKATSKYVVFIGLDNKRIYLGVYSTAEEASMVYEREAKRLFGEFYRELDVR